MPALNSAIISHSDVATFAVDFINLKSEDVEEYRQKVARLRDKIEVQIAEHPDYGFIKTLLAGSLMKGTALKTLNDIDIALYVRPAEAPGKEPELLDWLAERLRKVFPQMNPQQIKPVRHCVRIAYSVSGLNVDVTPVHYKGDADDRGNIYANTTGKPVLTSIPLHLRFIRARKEQQRLHFAQIVRLVKWWVRLRKSDDDSFRLKSFLAELLVAHIVDAGLNCSDYPAALETFFRYVVKSQLRQRVAFQDYYTSVKLPGPTGAAIEVFDPVNPANNVAEDYSDSDRRRIVEAATEAVEALAEARFATTKGVAAECWQQILGPSFRP